MSLFYTGLNNNDGTGKQDEASNDQTHTIQLSGNLRIKSLNLNGKVYPVGIKKPVRRKKKVSISIVVLSISGVPQIRDDEVRWDVLELNERLAQIGVECACSFSYGPQSPEFDVRDGVDLLVEDGSGKLKLASEGKSIIEKLGTAGSNADIHVFYTGTAHYYGYRNGVKEDIDGAGVAIIESVFDPGCVGYTYNIFVANDRPIFALAHQLGHLLTDREHYGEDYNDGGTPVKINLMRLPRAVGNVIDAPKRLNSKQEEFIYANPRVLDWE